MSQPEQYAYTRKILDKYEKTLTNVPEMFGRMIVAIVPLVDYLKDHEYPLSVHLDFICRFLYDCPPPKERKGYIRNLVKQKRAFLLSFIEENGIKQKTWAGFVFQSYEEIGWVARREMDRFYKELKRKAEIGRESGEHETEPRDEETARGRETGENNSEPADDRELARGRENAEHGLESGDGETVTGKENGEHGSESGHGETVRGRESGQDETELVDRETVREKQKEREYITDMETPTEKDAKAGKDETNRKKASYCEKDETPSSSKNDTQEANDKQRKAGEKKDRVKPQRKRKGQLQLLLEAQKYFIYK